MTSDPPLEARLFRLPPEREQQDLIRALRRAVQVLPGRARVASKGVRATMTACLDRFYERVGRWSPEDQARTGKRGPLEGPHLALWHALQLHLAPFHKEVTRSERQALRRHRGPTWAMEGAVLVLLAEDPVTDPQELDFPALGDWGSEHETYDSEEELAAISAGEFFGHRGMITWQATRPFAVYSVPDSIAKEHQDGLIWALARHCVDELKSLVDAAVAALPAPSNEAEKPQLGVQDETLVKALAVIAADPSLGWREIGERVGRSKSWANGKATLRQARKRAREQERLERRG